MRLFTRLLFSIFCLLMGACALDADLLDDEHEEGDEEENPEIGQTTDALGPVDPYQWPLKPFNRQHPVRGWLNDPRNGSGGSKAFHFGIDIAAPDGTPVFAVEAGTLQLSNPLTLSVRAATGKRTISYWHMRHVFGPGDNGKRIAKGQLLGRIETGWGHVHLGEMRGGKWINPLRRGGITPFADSEAPTIGDLTMSARPAQGKVDISVGASDKTPLRVQDPHWDDMPVGVALLRWRILQSGGGPAFPRDGDWIVGIDLRDTMLDRSRYDAVFAPGTYQNKPDKPGTYNYFLQHDWDSTQLANGFYMLEVEATDIRDHKSTKRFGFNVRN